MPSDQLFLSNSWALVSVMAVIRAFSKPLDDHWSTQSNHIKWSLIIVVIVVIVIIIIIKIVIASS